MTLRTRLFIPIAFVSLLVLASTVTGRAAASAPTTRITAAANVTMRAMPSPDATAVAQLPLGTEVTDAGPAGLDKTWVRVKLADGREGWLQTNLTRTLDPTWRWPVFDRIIAERLGRKGDGFAAQAELVAFIERVAPEYTNPEGRAQIEYSRLRAINAAANAIPARAGGREPYGAWLSKRKSDVVFDDPSGRWMLSSLTVWDSHTRFASTSISDELAWLAVTTGLPGECEGHLPCYFAARNKLQGEYLRRRAFGRHAAEAVATIRSTAETITPQSAGTWAFDRKHDCKALVEAVDALTAAVTGTRAEGREQAIASLGMVRKICQ
jgi:hypothetical protein